jgi:hypothetical protein
LLCDALMAARFGAQFSFSRALGANALQPQIHRIK